MKQKVFGPDKGNGGEPTKKDDLEDDCTENFIRASVCVVCRWRQTRSPALVSDSRHVHSKFLRKTISKQTNFHFHAQNQDRKAPFRPKMIACITCIARTMSDGLNYV